MRLSGTPRFAYPLKCRTNHSVVQPQPSGAQVNQDRRGGRDKIAQLGADDHAEGADERHTQSAGGGASRRVIQHCRRRPVLQGQRQHRRFTAPQSPLDNGIGNGCRRSPLSPSRSDRDAGGIVRRTRQHFGGHRVWYDQISAERFQQP